MAWTFVCDAAEVPDDTLKQFHVNGIAVLVVHYGGNLKAIPPICPHMEEPLAESGVIANCVLTCTKHLWAWDLRTLEMMGETEKPLKTYEIKEDAGRIFAMVDTELLYDFEEEDDMDDDFFSKS